MRRFLSRLGIGLLACSSITPFATQAQDHKTFDVSSIYQALDAPSQTKESVSPETPVWWDQHVSQSQRREIEPIQTDIHSLMYLALKYSNQIRIAAENPVIQETAVTEADSNFDWVKYLNSNWNDTSEPTSNSLTAGANQTRFNDHILQAAGGLRRRTRLGGELDVSQRFGYQDNNSQFFIPGDQATGRFTISYSHPLLRGSGYAYNNSLVILAQLDAESAQDDFRAELQNHLLEVARNYWALYQERAVLAQQVKLYLKTKQIVDILKTRQAIDAQRTQYITASSALATRRSDLIRARTAVINAETRLRGLINAPELRASDVAELVPVEFPSMNYLPVELRSQIHVSIQNRPEVHAAIKQVRAGATRLGIAENEMLPALNLVTQGYLSGLRGSSDFGGAFGDQFSRGAPSYSLGLQYEMPVGNRLAISRLNRRKIELRQLQRQYSQALEAIQTEVDIAVREVQTAYREIKARGRALAAAEAEAQTIEVRWSSMIDGSGASSLNLESLLRAQERVTASEREYVTSVLTYNLAVVNLKKANGTLLQSENVVIGRTQDTGDGTSLYLDKGQPQSQGAEWQHPEPRLQNQMPTQTNSLQPVSTKQPLPQTVVSTQPRQEFEPTATIPNRQMESGRPKIVESESRKIAMPSATTKVIWSDAGGPTHSVKTYDSSQTVVVREPVKSVVHRQTKQPSKSFKFSAKQVSSVQKTEVTTNAVPSQRWQVQQIAPVRQLQINPDAYPLGDAIKQQCQHPSPRSASKTDSRKTTQR